MSFNDPQILLPEAILVPKGPEKQSARPEGRAPFDFAMLRSG